MAGCRAAPDEDFRRELQPGARLPQARPTDDLASSSSSFFFFLAEHPTRSRQRGEPVAGLMPFTEATQAFFTAAMPRRPTLRRVRRERLTILSASRGSARPRCFCAGLFHDCAPPTFPVISGSTGRMRRSAPVAQIKQALAENLAAARRRGPPPRPRRNAVGLFPRQGDRILEPPQPARHPGAGSRPVRRDLHPGPWGRVGQAVLDELAALIENRPPGSVRAALETIPKRPAATISPRRAAE